MGLRRMLVSVGQLDAIRDSMSYPKPVEGAPRVAAVGQGGMFDVVPHPKYTENGWIYFAFNGPGDGGPAFSASARQADRRTFPCIGEGDDQ